MGLISHVSATGLGYALARPEGRRQLLKLRDLALALARHPKVIEFRDRGARRLVHVVSAATATVTQTLRGAANTTASSPLASPSAVSVASPPADPSPAA